MTKKRQHHTAEFKAKVALAAIAGEQTVSQICSKFKVQANQVTRWKKELLDNSPSIFSKKHNSALEEKKEEVDILYKQVGKLTVQNEFLREKLYP